MHKKFVSFNRNFVLLSLFAFVLTCFLLVLFTCLGIHPALAKDELKNNVDKHTEITANTYKAHPLQDKVLLCVEGGFDALLTDENKSVLDSAGSYNPLETLIELSSTKEVIQKISYNDSADDISEVAKDPKSTNQTKPKSKIVSLSVDNADSFIDRANQLDCVVWAEKDFSLTNTNTSNPEGDIEIVADDEQSSNDKKISDDKSNKLQDMLEPNTGKATDSSNFKNSDNTEEKDGDGASQGLKSSDAGNLSADEPAVFKETPSFTPKKLPNYDPYFKDPYSSEQWQYYEPGYGINAQKIWEESKDIPPLQNNNPVVAVVDTGVAYDHPDLVNSMWKNGTSIDSLKALGGGEYGANFSGKNYKIDDPYDDVGHGTHCASLIAAENDNFIGGSSLNGTNVKIMAIKALAATGEESDLECFIKAYNYIIEAKKSNVNVVCISNSWGIGLDSIYSLNWIFNNLVFEAYKAGMVSCFAAGNSSINMDVSTNACHLNEPGYFTVGAATDIGEASYFSNYGNRYCDVFSPGVQTLSAVSPKTKDNQCRQFLPWLEADPEDVFYYKDFNDNDLSDGSNVFNGIEFNAYQNGLKMDNATFFKSDGRVAFGLDKEVVNPGDNISLMMSIKRNDLLKMSQESEFPWFSFRYSLDDSLSIDLTKKIKINYIIYQDDGAYVNPLPFKLEEGHIAIRNTTRPVNVLNEHVFSTELNSSKFINNRVDEKYDDDSMVDILLDFDIEDISENSCFCIDDFAFGKNPSSYHYMSGTSMACPIVSSLISCLASRYNQSLDNPCAVDTILDCVKGGVKHSTALEGKCVTEGVIDAYNSLVALKSVIDGDKSISPSTRPSIDSFDLPASDPNNIQVAINGRFFGLEKNRVLCDGEDLAIDSWSDDCIKVIITQKDFDFAAVHEIKVVRTDGIEGRGFLELPESGSVGYETLGTSGIIYHDSRGREYTTDSLIPASCVSTPNNYYIYYAGADMESNFPGVLECYNYSSKSWKTINTESLGMIGSKSDNFFMQIANCDAIVSLAAGKDELYMLYVKKDSRYQDENIKYPYFSLATYSEEKGEFIYDVDIDYSRLGDRIFTYNGELYLYGLDEIDNALGGTFRNSNMYKIFPDNGKYYECKPFNNFATSGDGVTCYQDDVWLASSLCTSYDAFIDEKCSQINPGCEDFIKPLYVSPRKLDLENDTFDTYSEDIYTYSELADLTQNIRTGTAVAVDKGVIFIGQVVNNGSPLMQDTYLLNKDTNSYSTLTTVTSSKANALSSSARCDNFKPRAITAAAHDNKLYVCSASGTKYSNEFKVLDLTKYGLLSQGDECLSNVDISANHPLPTLETAKEWSDKTVAYDLVNKDFKVPGTDYTNNDLYQGNDNTAQTNDLLTLLIVVLIVLLVVALSIFIKKNKDLNCFTTTLNKVLLNRISYSVGIISVSLLLTLLSLNYAFAENGTTGYVDKEGNVLIEDYTLSDFTSDINQFYVSSFSIAGVDSSVVDVSKVNLEITYKDFTIFSQKCHTINSDRFFSYKWENDNDKLQFKLTGFTNQELYSLDNFQIILDIKFREFDRFMFDKLDDYSLDQLKVVADNISEFAESSIWYDSMKNFAEHGETKLIVMENLSEEPYYYAIDQKLYCRIVGINHDDSANCPGKKAGLTFMSVVSTNLSEPYIQDVDIDTTNQINWSNSTIMKDIQKGGVFYNLMPGAFKENVQSVNKLYHTGKNIIQKDEPTGINSIANVMFIPSASELRNFSQNEEIDPSEGDMYEYIHNDPFLDVCPQWDRGQTIAPVMSSIPYIVYDYLIGRYITPDGKSGQDYLTEDSTIPDVYNNACYDLGIILKGYSHTRTVSDTLSPNIDHSYCNLSFDHYGHLSSVSMFTTRNGFNPMFCL